MQFNSATCVPRPIQTTAQLQFPYTDTAEKLVHCTKQNAKYIFFCQNAHFRLYLGVYTCMYTSINYYMPLDVLHCTRTSFWWFTSTPSSISLLTSSSSPPLVAIMRSLQSSIWNTAVLELYCSLTKLDTAIMTYHYLLLFIIYYAVMKCYNQYHDQMIC